MSNHPFAGIQFHPVVDYKGPFHHLDLSQPKDPKQIKALGWAIGGYNEKREAMYLAAHYEGRRNIHVGIDIWHSAGTPLYNFYDGTIVYQRFNDRDLDYGATIVTRHVIQGQELYALWGHLNRAALSYRSVGDPIQAGAKIAEMGPPEENGGWLPHLHLQLSWVDPGEADMPGVVAEEDRQKALNQYPDPRLVLEPLY